MKTDNPLTREFLLHYPEEAARVLEQLSDKHLAALFSELPAQMTARVMAFMLPIKAAAAQEFLQPLNAASMLAELPVSSAARIFRFLSESQQQQVSAQLGKKTLAQIQRYLDYQPESAGALLDSAVDMLPENLTVTEALRYIERLEHSIKNEIYIVDSRHQLVGMIELGKLLAVNRHARLRDIMSHKTQAISAHTSTATLLSHPGWNTRRRLPVIERDNTLLGALDYSHLQASVGHLDKAQSSDPLANLLSLFSLYWLSVAQLLDSVLSAKVSNKGEQS